MRRRVGLEPLVWCALWALLGGCAAGRGLDPRTAAFPAPVFVPPSVQEEQLAGGMPVFLLEDHDVPLVRLYLGFRGGSVHDPEGRAGLAQVASRAWRTGGAGSLSPEEVDAALDDRGMELQLSIGRDSGWMQLSLLPEDLGEGLALLAELVLAPAFRAERVEWAKTQVAEGIRREEDDPQALAFREMRRALYRGHPRGVIPSEVSVGRVTRDDVVGLQRRLVEEGAWVLGAVGDFQRAPLLADLQDHFGGLPGAGPGFAVPPPPPPPDPVAVVVPKHLPQAVLVWARLGPSRRDPAFYPLELVDHVLGAGGFQSRLVREIRSNRGLAYSVGSFYEALPEFGVLGCYASTKLEAALEVLGLVGATLDETARGGVTAPELEAARQAVVNRHVFRYADPASLVREQLGLRLDGLPADLVARYPAAIEGVSLAQAAAAAATHLLPQAGVTVVVGAVDPQQLARATGLAVEVRELP